MTNTLPYRIACIGECMVEFSTTNNPNDNLHSKHYIRKFAGDTFNTAYYLNRLSSNNINVSYITALGNDSISDELREFILSTGIETTLIPSISGLNIGLYLIENDDKGERYFHYWRNDSAAKKMFNSPHGQNLLDQLNAFDSLYLSGITLAILDDEGAKHLKTFLKQYKGQCYFDPNFRPALWSSSDQASQVMHDVIPDGTTVLTTLDDEINLHKVEDSNDVIALWRKQGCQNVIVKDSNRACHAFVNGRYLSVNANENIQPIDTTGAGDAFNSGYISSIIAGMSVEESIMTAHRLAAEVIQYKGALIT